MSTIFVTLMTIIFIGESFWEFRLFTFLTSQLPMIRSEHERQQLSKALKLDRRWNWGSWILIFIIFVTPSSVYLPLVSLLCLFETLMVMRMDQLKRKYFN
ncbi:MAG TPA: hypothetical protein H9792_06365 [Candidatus Limosilactobacillus excrementigallinarum]|nr:hypothetical protein [Candidatus Limosilactobacillus excrementigallinarum]